MKIYSFLYSLFIIPVISGFDFNINRIETRSISYLLKDIENHKIKNLYISNDLSRIYYKEVDIDTLSPSQNLRSIASPAIIPKVLDATEKEGIESFIMEYNPENRVDLGQVVDMFLIGTFLYIGFSIFRSFLFQSAFQNRGNRGTPFPPFLSSGKKTDDIKINLEKSNITMSSWAGSPEVFEECVEIISYMKNSTQYKLAGAEIPKGILLEGPPGTGKTLIAKAIASETNATFISVSASEFVELFVGIGAAKVRDLFKTARENCPAIIFIDEIDSIGKQRGVGFMAGNDEREQTLNQILAEMDGFEPNEDILIIAATNRKDILDSALLRPGRFDRIVYVPLPDKNSRKAILSIYLQKKQTEAIELDLVAEMTQGFSGAQIKNLVNEAAIYTARQGRTIITQKDIEDALEKLVVGIIKKVDTRNLDTRRRIAIHELGHTFMTYYFSEYFQLSKVTIQSTYSGAGGYTLYKESPTIEGLYTKDILKKRLMIALGGKAAELIFYGTDFISLGAIQDLKEANGLAKRMITNYGMGNYLEVFYDDNRGEGSMKTYSDKRLEQIDDESLFLLTEAFDEVVELLKADRENIEKVLSILLKKESLTQGEFLQILRSKPSNSNSQ